ncbi:MAG: STAS domain-containing protein [Actinomycetota bacterium]|nr:STAS domain-containing protein [Actinomycetota bacterium]
MTTPSSRRDFDRFRVDIAPERDTVRVTPVGELDLATVSQLDDQLRELRQAGFRRFVLDLRELLFMDSAGLRLILRFDARAREDAIDVALIAGSPAVQRVFEVSGTLELLTFRSS